jgi:hypothetical protein
LAPPFEEQRLPRAKRAGEDIADYRLSLQRLRLSHQKIRILERQVGEVYQLMKRLLPSDNVVVHALPHPELALVAPTTVTLAPIAAASWQANLPELSLAVRAKTREAAIRGLLRTLVNKYLTLEPDPTRDLPTWLLLQQLVRRCNPRHPPSVSVVVHTLPHPALALVTPTTLTLAPARGPSWQATLPELSLAARAKTKEVATRDLLRQLVTNYLNLEQDPSADLETWQQLQQLVHRSDLRLPTKPPTALPAHDPESTVAPTLGEWLKINAPRDNRGITQAWSSGASARFHGRNECRYRTESHLNAWTDGYSVMSSYLDAGGLFTCSSCKKPWAGTPSTTVPTTCEPRTSSNCGA